MPTLPRLRRLVLLLVFLALAPALRAQESPPLLSATIKATLEKDGIEAAKAKFDEIYPDQSDAYQFDMKGMAELGSGYMQAGDFEKGGAVMEMVSAMSRAAMMASMSPAQRRMMEEAQAKEEQQQEEREQQRRSEARARTQPPLSDEVAQRYEGVYQDPNEPNENRRYFLARDPCGPRIMFGAMWGDAQNIYLDLESENLLAQPAEQATYQAPLRIQIEFGSAGRAQRLTLDSELFPGTMERVDELPEGWKNSQCTMG